jgi:hypothetical protein
MGVAYQRLGEKDPKYYKDAIDYHLKHNQIGDIAGKFISFVNLGMIYNLMGENEKAVVNNQHALRYAIQMSSVAGQTIAIGNLGRIGAKYNANYKKDYSGAIISDKKKLMMFVERYLELSSELSHKKGEAGAHLQLGMLKQEEVYIYILMI